MAFWKLHGYTAIEHRLVLTNLWYTGTRDLCTQHTLHSLGELSPVWCLYLSLSHGLSQPASSCPFYSISEIKITFKKGETLRQKPVLRSQRTRPFLISTWLGIQIKIRWLPGTRFLRTRGVGKRGQTARSMPSNSTS